MACSAHILLGVKMLESLTTEPSGVQINNQRKNKYDAALISTNLSFLNCTDFFSSGAYRLFYLWLSSCTNFHVKYTKQVRGDEEELKKIILVKDIRL